MTKFELLEKNIINLLGLESLPLEEKQVIIGKATDLVEQRVLLRLFQMLKKEDERELKKIQNEDQK